MASYYSPITLNTENAAVMQPMGATDVQKINILGVSGSIGQSTLKVLDDYPERYRVGAICGGHDVQALADAAIRTKAQFVAIADETKLEDLKTALCDHNCVVAAGAGAVLDCGAYDADIVVSAIVGFAGLEPTLKAAEQGARIALANKEALVSAGHFLKAKVKAQDGILLPVDSEHNAIFQCLQGSHLSHVSEIIITGSGGPFRTWSQDDIAKAPSSEALKHPNWTMGRKITIDSATLMNKGLEFIEACHLFDIENEKFSVIIHPQSIIHGMVRFEDGAVIAEMGTADMSSPISHCLAYPDRIETQVKPLDFMKIKALTFEEPDLKRFPNLGLAQVALAQGDFATNALNAANEVAVDAYLNDRISFYQMTHIIEAALEDATREFSGMKEIASFEEAQTIDLHARGVARVVLNQVAGA